MFAVVVALMLLGARKLIAWFGLVVAADHTPSSTDFITTTPELKFSSNTIIKVRSEAAAGTPTSAAIASARATTGTATPSPRPGRAAATPPEIGIDAGLPSPVVVA